MTYRWRGPQPARDEEQIANAPDDLFALPPVSETPAATVRSKWAATLPDPTNEAALIWED